VTLRLLLIAAVLVLAAPAAAAPPSVDARAVLVENGTNGEVLYRSHDRDRIPIASITKLMTALLAVERLRPDDVVVAPSVAAAVGESTIDLQPGEQITVHDLLEAALIQSANDAAWALAYRIGNGSVERFVTLMNRRARQLGLRDTHYARPDGLDAPGHYSSARDVTRLARIVMRHPALREIVGMRTATISGGRTLYTWNDLLGNVPGLVGVKTGHTSLAGWNEVAAVRARGLTLYATLLGSASREQRNADLSQLITWGLGQYGYAPVVSRRRTYATATVGFGRGTVRLVAARPAYRAVRVGRPLLERVVAPRSLDLPVERGKQYGEVRVYERGRLVARRPLVAARSESRPGLLGRAGWYVSRTAETIGGWFS
jgi:D-alanyl-D-alanine carboxypeptidase (penicillin-binding protein 5/6)